MGSTLRIALPSIARTDKTPQEVTNLPTREVEAAGIGSKVEEEGEGDFPPLRDNGEEGVEEACKTGGLDTDFDDELEVVFLSLRSCIVLASACRGQTDMIKKLSTMKLRYSIEKLQREENTQKI